MKLQDQDYQSAVDVPAERNSLFDGKKDCSGKDKAFRYHIALSLPLDLESVAKDAQMSRRPGHLMWVLSQRLGAVIHKPTSDLVSPLDKMRAKIIGKPEHWALANTLSSQLKSNDLVYCTGEDVGIPLAVLCKSVQNRPKLVVYIHNLDRPRGHLALKLFSLANWIDLFVTCSRHQGDLLCRHLRIPEDRICLLSEQTDTTFFTPGPASQNKLRPLIVSGGLEKRDYQTLADATGNLDVDVRICAFSANATTGARTLPKITPENMSFRFYDWFELVQLYRDANIVVISLRDNNHSAGLTTLLEAMACRRPVVVTRTQGLIVDLIDSGFVTGVKPNDPIDLRQAIVRLWENPQEAEAQAQRGYELILKQHNSEQYIETLAHRLALL